LTTPYTGSGSPTRTSASANLLLIWRADPGLDQRGAGFSEAGGPTVDPLALARAVSLSPVWGENPGVTLVVRPSPRPTLGVLGRFDADDERRLAQHASELGFTLPTVRYVGYDQVREDCERLGTLLVERFGRDELRCYKFVAIPRGGLIVLGMLSYVLGLQQSQLEPPASPEEPVIVVDDCALSGSRFGRFLARCESQRVTFAHLYSHPDLRTAIEASEPAVVSCLGARDLGDDAPVNHGKEYNAWRRRWAARHGDRRYWIGQPEHLCFPWSEPDSGIWNPVTERVEKGWSLLPPELCLKNRPAPGVEPIPVQVQSDGPGPLRPAAQVLCGEFEGQVVVADTDTEESFSLSGVAADVWRAVVEKGNVEDAVSALAGEYDIDHQTLEADARGFVAELVSRDLLENARCPTH
jgi:hypothetical protein